MRYHIAPRPPGRRLRRCATVGLTATAIVVSGAVIPRAAVADTPSTVVVTADCANLTATVEVSGVSPHPNSLRNGHAYGDGNANNPKGSTPASNTGSDGSYDYTVTDVPITSSQTTMTGYIQGPVVSNPHENVGTGHFTACHTTPSTGQATATISCTPDDHVVITVSGSGMFAGSDVGTSVTEQGTTYRDLTDGNVDHNGNYTGNPITTPDSLGFATVEVNSPGPSYSAEATGNINIPDCDDAPPGPPHHSTLFADGPNTATYGALTDVLAALRDSVTGEELGDEQVNLYARAGGSGPFTKVITLTTTSHGIAEYDPRMTRTTSYYWTYAGDSRHLGTTSNTMTVTVSPGSHVFTLATVNHHTIRIHHRVRFYGTVAPAIKGEKIYLQHYSHGHWHHTKAYGVIKLRRLPNGHRAYGYVITRRLATKGTYAFRMYVKATSNLAAAYSKTIKVKVRKPKHH